MHAEAIPDRLSELRSARQTLSATSDTRKHDIKPHEPQAQASEIWGLRPAASRTPAGRYPEMEDTREATLIGYGGGGCVEVLRLCTGVCCWVLRW